MDAPQVPTLPPAPGAAPAVPSAPLAPPAPPVTSAPTWAPPGSSPAPGTPGATPLTFSPVPDEPRRSRGPLFAVLAVVALLVIGVGAVFALRGGGGGGDTLVEAEDSSAFSLAAAAERTTAATTVRYEMLMSMGALGDMTMRGGIDNDARIMTMTMDMGGFIGGDELGEFEAIIDIGNGVMYISNPAMLGMPSDAAWVSMDLAEVAGQSGMSIEDFQDQFSANPLDVAELFTVADDAVDLGADTIDGVEVRHYRVTVDIADVMDANPQVGQQFDLDMMPGDFPETIDYDVWVTEDNQLRRMTFSLDVLGQEMTVVMNVTDVDEPLVVTIPAPDEVADMTDLLGF